MLLTCQHHSSSDKRESLLQELKVWLQSVKTDQDITAFVIGGLRSCFLNPFCDEPLNHTSEATTYYALTHQLDIAWFELLCRYVTTDDLIKYQQAHYQSIASGKHSTSWGRQLSSQLWNLTRSILIHRNSVLHETSPSHVLSGLDTLHLSITAGQSLRLALIYFTLLNISDGTDHSTKSPS